MAKHQWHSTSAARVLGEAALNKSQAGRGSDGCVTRDRLLAAIHQVIESDNSHR
ncbi:MAG: hypothetical protein V7L29_25900 [Nostoc sp.]|uniref:hypothetical protein n=1 Tax=Nostoc sp. TaxID=1180 RepID=UPI002FF5965C